MIRTLRHLFVAALATTAALAQGQSADHRPDAGEGESRGRGERGHRGTDGRRSDADGFASLVEAARPSRLDPEREP